MTPYNTCLLVIDVQERLAPVISDHDQIVSRINKLIQIAKIFELPIVYTEQAPDKIGHTVDDIKKNLPANINPIKKKTFSCYGTPEFVHVLTAINCPNILITGVETHVCVYQTAADLKRHGYNVFVCADAVGSRKEIDTQWALERLSAQGITIVTSEMVICELLKTAAHPKFKEVMNYIK